jgi:hypothetical protein
MLVNLLPHCPFLLPGCHKTKFTAGKTNLHNQQEGKEKNPSTTHIPTHTLKALLEQTLNSYDPTRKSRREMFSRIIESRF